MLTLESIAAQTLIDIRERCKKDPIYLAHAVLGREYFLTPAPFHVDAAKALVDEVDTIFLAPRNHAKTTLFDEVGSIFDLIRNPNLRILIATSTLTNSASLLKLITHHFKYNEKFRTVFPEYAINEKEEEGNKYSFTVPCRTANYKEASIEIAGQDTAITGRHYDVIRCSDLVVRENVPPASSKDQMLRTIEWFRTTSALLDTTNPKARRLIDGTRWHDGDLYGELLKNPAYTNFRKIIIGIQEVNQTPENRDGVPVPVWDRMGLEKLTQIRLEAGSYLWAANYKNNPVPGDGATFQKEWFKLYEQAPERMDIAITVDLAISDKERSDRTAIVVSGIDVYNNLYVLSCYAGRWSPYETIDRLFALSLLYQPTYVGIESVAWQKAMIFIIDEEMKKRNLRLPIKPLLPISNKAGRAFPLAVHAERSGIYVKQEHQELVDEFIRFPVGTHDDIVDALAYRAQDLQAPYALFNQLEIVPNYTIKNDLTGAKLLEMVEDTGLGSKFSLEDD